MKNNNVIYIAIMGMIVLACMFGGNYKSHEMSLIDNRFLAEFPKQIDENFTKNLSNYVQDRIAFRNEMIHLYNEINNRAFQIFPNHIYGKQGNLFGIGTEYIASYQHLNGDEEYAEYFTGYISKLEEYCKDKGIEFIYMLTPDKTTIYPEYMPESIGVYKANNLTEIIKRKIIERNVRHVFVDDVFNNDKLISEPLFYKRFDVAHWSDYGHILGINAVLKELNLAPLFLENDFEKVETVIKKQLVSEVIIDDELTLYKPLFAYEKQDVKDIEKLQLISKDSFGIFKNPGKDKEEQKRLLLLGDSYLGENLNFFGDRFSEIVFVHAYDVFKLQMLINLFKPDIVMFENVERAMSEFYPKDLIKNCESLLIPSYSRYNDLITADADSFVNLYVINDEETNNQCKGSMNDKFWVIQGTALDENNTPGTGIYAQIGNEIYTPDYYVNGAFEFTVDTESLIEQNVIEFLLVNDGKKIKYNGANFDICFK